MEEGKNALPAAVVVRSYRSGDELEINRLFNETFATDRSLDEWQWKFARNPTNVTMITVAESEGKIVGQYAEIWNLFQYCERNVLATMPVDNFIVPRHRGGFKGVQKRMFEFPDRRRQGPLGFGFPTKAHYVVGLRMLKYLDLGRMPVLFKRLNIRLGLRARMPWLPTSILEAIRSTFSYAYRAWLRVTLASAPLAISTAIVDSFDARFDELWARVKLKHNIICVRDQRYLRWRYSKPDSCYQVVIAEKKGAVIGYAVVSVKKDSDGLVGRLVDFVTDGTPGADAALARRALLELLSHKVDYVLGWMLPDKESFKRLRALGFTPRPHAFPPVHIVSQVLDPDNANAAIVGNPTNWYLTMGDSDVF